MIGSRRFFGTQSPLNFRVVRIPPGGINYLLDYSDAVFLRSSEAAMTDPRDGWSFKRIFGLNNPDKAGTNIVDSSNYTSGSSAWTHVNDPIHTADSTVAPDGTTTADTLEDDDAGAFEYIEQTISQANSTEMQIEVWIKKDTDQTRFPSIYAITGFGGPEIQINTQTGEWAYRVGSAKSVDVQEAVSGWWRVVIINDSTSTTGIVRLYPARGASLGASAANAVGATIFWGCRIAPTNAVGEGPFAVVNEPRIFSDNSILIEASRTNIIDYSRDAGPVGNQGNWTAGTGFYEQRADIVAADSNPLAMRSAVNANAFGPTNTITSFESGSNAVSVYQQLFSEVSGSTFKHGVSGTLLSPAGTTEISMSSGSWERSSFIGVETESGSMSWSLSGRSIDAGDTTTPDFDIAWDLVQWEEGAFVTSPIRTDGAVTTRAADDCQLAEANVAAALWNIGFTVDYTPNHDSGSDFHETEYILQSDNTAERNYLRLIIQGATTSRIVYRGSGASGTSLFFTFSAFDKITLVVKHGLTVTILINEVLDQTMDISTLAAWTPGDLMVGQDLVNGNVANGVITRPIGL